MSLSKQSSIVSYTQNKPHGPTRPPIVQNGPVQDGVPTKVRGCPRPGAGCPRPVRAINS